MLEGSDVSAWVCDYCSRAFPDQTSARSHEQTSHWRSTCSWCKETIGPGPYGPTRKKFLAHEKTCPVRILSQFERMPSNWQRFSDREKRIVIKALGKSTTRAMVESGMRLYTDNIDRYMAGQKKWF